MLLTVCLAKLYTMLQDNKTSSVAVYVEKNSFVSFTSVSVNQLIHSITKSLQIIKRRKVDS